MKQRLCLSLLIVTIAPVAVAQNKFATVNGSASPHLPTIAECIEALNAGQVLPPTPDGRIRVFSGDILYMVDLTPASITCEGVRYSD